MPKITVKLDETRHEALPLHKPGREVEAEVSSVNDFSAFEDFKASASKNIHTKRDMCATAALLSEMQNRNCVPEGYFEISKVYSWIDENDCVFYAYCAMKDIYKSENIVECACENLPQEIYVTASQSDDISAVALVNNSSNVLMLPLFICGLPGKDVHIECFVTDEQNKNAMLFSSNTKLTETTVMLPIGAYSLYVLKIR